MPEIKFNPEVSIGSIITILALFVSLVGGWTMLSSTVTANTNRITSVEQKFDVASLKTIEQREAALAAQVDLARTLTALQADVRYLRVAVDEINRGAAASSATPGVKAP